MTHKEVYKTLMELESKENEIALNYVIKEARKILRQNPSLSEFVMCMGSWFFTYKNGDIVHNEPKYILESSLSKFITDWDGYLRITGNPVRFSKDSMITKDW